MTNLTIEVQHLQHGQPGPYQPHVYESRITTRGERSWDRLTEDQMRAMVKAVVHFYVDEPEDGSMGSHFKPRLKRLERVSEEGEGLGPRIEVWIARVEDPYTD